MRPNQKLTTHLAGRTIKDSSRAGGKLDLHLDDGSTLSVKVAASASTTVSVPAGARLLKAREQDTSFALDLEGGQSLSLTLADAGSSVMLRGADGKMAYAG